MSNRIKRLLMEEDTESDGNETDNSYSGNISDTIGSLVSLTISEPNAASINYIRNPSPTYLDFQEISSGSLTTEPLIDVGLLINLLQGKCDSTTQAVENLVWPWHCIYSINRFEALRSLLQLLLNATGAMVFLTRRQALYLGMHNVGEFNDWVHVSYSKHLILNDVFLKNFLEFLKLALKEDILEDYRFVRQIFHVLSMFIDSVWPLARYTACILGSLIMNQYASYLPRLRRKAAAEPSDAHNLRKMETFENFFTMHVHFLLMGLRDTSLYIRKAACKLCFRWFIKREPVLMQDLYLRNLYWSLFDESPLIRKCVIQTCKLFIDIESVNETFPMFARKMVPEIANRIRDESTQVALVALNFIAETYRRAPLLLREYGVLPDFIYLLIYSTDEILSKKVARFIKEVLWDNSSTRTDFLKNMVMFTCESLMSLKQYNKDLKTERALRVFVRRFFVQCREELTDWEAWKIVLLHDCCDVELEKEASCSMLLQIIDWVTFFAGLHRSIELEYPPVPRLGDQAPKNHPLKDYCLEKLESLILILGPVLPQLWNEYKENVNSLTKLITIPQHFDGRFESLDVELLCCNLLYLKNVLNCSLSLTAVHRTLSFIYNYMLGSEEWKDKVHSFELILFRVTRKFWKHCTLLAYKHLHDMDQLKNIKIIKANFFLSKFFDVSKTILAHDAFKVLELGVSSDLAEIICPVTMICLNIIQWEMKKLNEDSTNQDLKIVLLSRIQSQSNLLFKNLEGLLQNANNLLKENAYSVTCRLVTLLCPHNKYAVSFPMIHLSPLSLTTSEWLHYFIHNELSRTQIPEGENKVEDARSCLDLFCHVLVSGMISEKYSVAVLHYYKFYNEPANYNDILRRFFWSMNEKFQHFPHLIIDGLMWIKLQYNVEMEIIATGFINVISQEMPQECIQKVVYELVVYGISRIQNKNHHFVFSILSHMAKFLKKRDAQDIYDKVGRAFNKFKETECLNKFLSSFHCIPRKKGSSYSTVSSDEEAVLVTSAEDYYHRAHGLHDRAFAATR